jgi:hypothetical protein
MILKEDKFSHLNDFKVDTNKQLTECKENSNKKLNEIRKIRQGMK